MEVISIMKKRYISLVLAVCLFAGSALTAQAEVIKGKDGWKAEFTGKEIESNFTSQAFADEIVGLQGGDSIEIRIAVKNSSDSGTEWYMSNEVLQSLEDGTQAQNGAYKYELTYYGSGDPVTLFSSESVGGENSPAGKEGLHEVSEQLEQYLYLDHLDKGAEGYITLLVTLNGETQNAGYQNTLARLQLNFAVEKTRGGGSGSSGGGGSQTSSSQAASGSGNGSFIFSPGAVQTSDPGGMVFWSVAALVSGLALFLIALIWQKRKREEQEYE